jgi:hypothetical protein
VVPKPTMKARVERSRTSSGCNFRQLPANQWLHPGQKLLRADAEQQQCLVVSLHAVPFDFAHDQLP